MADDSKPDPLDDVISKLYNFQSVGPAPAAPTVTERLRDWARDTRQKIENSTDNPFGSDDPVLRDLGTHLVKDPTAGLLRLVEGLAQAKAASDSLPDTQKARAQVPGLLSAGVGALGASGFLAPEDKPVADAMEAGKKALTDYAGEALASGLHEGVDPYASQVQDVINQVHEALAPPVDPLGEYLKLGHGANLVTEYGTKGAPELIPNDAAVSALQKAHGEAGDLLNRKSMTNSLRFDYTQKAHDDALAAINGFFKEKGIDPNFPAGINENIAQELYPGYVHQKTINDLGVKDYNAYLALDKQYNKAAYQYENQLQDGVLTQRHVKQAIEASSKPGANAFTILKTLPPGHYNNAIDLLNEYASNPEFKDLADAGRHYVHNNDAITNASRSLMGMELLTEPVPAGSAYFTNVSPVDVPNKAALLKLPAGQKVTWYGASPGTTEEYELTGDVNQDTAWYKKIKGFGEGANVSYIPGNAKETETLSAPAYRTSPMDLLDNTKDTHNYLTMDEAKQHAAVLHSALRGVGETGVPLHRGMEFSDFVPEELINLSAKEGYKAGPHGGQYIPNKGDYPSPSPEMIKLLDKYDTHGGFFADPIDKLWKTLTPGDEVQLPLSSWSRSKGTALSFAGESAGHSDLTKSVVLHLTGPHKSISMTPLSHFSEYEYVTGGRFRVESVTNEEGILHINLTQKGVH